MESSTTLIKKNKIILLLKVGRGFFFFQKNVLWDKEFGGFKNKKIDLDTIYIF